MARELVYDLASGKQEYIDFVPVSDPMRPFDASCYDNQFERPVDYRDHTKPQFPRPSVRAAILNSIHSIEFDAEAKRQYTNPCDALFKATRRHGDFAKHMVRAFTNIIARKDYFTALQAVQSADERLRRNGVRYTRNDEEIVELAKAKARAFSRQLLKIKDIDARFEKAQQLIGSLGLSFRSSLIEQKENNDDLESLCNRACCDIWLRRQLRRAYFVEVENVARDLLLVHKSQDAYCSSHSVNVIKERKSDTEQALINTVCYLDDDPETWFTLQELAAKSTSNPMIRRAEMFVRLRAFEEIAQESGHVAMFYTVTAPSRFHVYSGDDVNPAWEAANKPSAVDAHQYLMGVSDAFRKDLNKAKIKLYGLRIVEPHHDGTPHNHMLYFMQPEDKETVTSLLHHHALRDSPNEKGAKKYRFKVEEIDFEKGSAVGYVAKYLSKNIDGEHIQKDRDTDQSGKQAANSVVSFNRLNGIRQFQFYGGPSVTVWREMRRFREEFKEDDAVILGNQLSKDEHFVLESIRRAADDGDFKRFVVAMGGVLVRRKDQTVKTAYAQKVDVTGLLRQTRYGDEMSAAIEGILFQGKIIKTRFKEWKFANKKQFIRGMRSIMSGTNLVFETLQDELEYYAMKQEEYERMQEECAFMLDMPSIEPSVLCGDDVYSVDALPPDCCWGWAQPDLDSSWVALDLCH